MLTFNELGKYGRLGNQMFQIASTIGIAKMLGYDFGFPEWIYHDHKNRFGSEEDINIQDYFVNKLPAAGETLTDLYMQWGFHGFAGIEDRTNLSGHMQSEKYFKHCEDTIRHYFEFKDKSIEIPDNSIAIHVRRGDYDDNYHPTMKADYYEKAMQFMPACCPIYVFSDDPEQAIKMLGDSYKYVTGNHYIKDLQLMTQCKHFILSNSTFCWWGWWLSGKQGQVVAPKNWFGRIAGITAEDIYTPEMIII